MLNSATIVAHCRIGFETECASDLESVAAQARMPLAIDARRDRAMVTAVGVDDVRCWNSALAATPPQFARSLFAGSGPHVLSSRDRIGPLIALVADLRPPFQSVWLETADTNEGKTHSGLCRRLAPLFEAELASRKMLVRGAADRPRLHVLFETAERAWVGTSEAPTGSAWPMGIPRLTMPGAAPSRSTLKLAEAFVTFLDEQERVRAFVPGMRAVDLGAAPGGWTWQLIQRGLAVVAVDNGPLQASIAGDPLVEHLRVDGLTYRPRRAVDWMVCDMVLQPSRIATLVAGWLADGACRRTIFNLKLPMKKRYAEVQRCQTIIGETLDARRVRHTLRFRQLYHDREEITGYCARSG
ncbi:MAG: 23S rRNA (cytidine(2498)-2'-O)-methyltransferase RlmM [Casimicrobiaceae bacterium]